MNGQHAGSSNEGYWGGWAAHAMTRIGDYKSRFYDGASGGFANTLTRGYFTNNNLFGQNRRKSGYSQGTKDAAQILSSLERDRTGAITESVKIVSHSMGQHMPEV